MDAQPPRRRILITNVAFYLIIASVAARAAFELEKPSDIMIMIGMLILYLASLVFESRLISRNLNYLHGINLLQASIGLLLLFFIGGLDFFALLLVPLCVQSILNFPHRTALIWIGAACLLMEAILLERFPLSQSVGFIIIYPAAIFLFCGSAYLALQAEAAQNRSEKLLADLQKANQKLHAYAIQVQELAAANERTRLARELHDSVTQIIFGLTLSAQAARILIDRNPARVAVELDHMQELAQSALAEMRALVQELHPHSPAEEGLVPALRRLVAERASQDSLGVDLRVKGERHLPANIESELFRVAQEALNNIVKHARTNRATISLDLDDDRRVLLCIEDAGIGFNLEQARSRPGHLGLTSMEERIQALGGMLAIDSQPGKGTRLCVELALEQEAQHA